MGSDLVDQSVGRKGRVITVHKGKTNFEVVYPFSTRELKNKIEPKSCFFVFFLTNEKNDRFIVSAYLISN